MMDIFGTAYESTIDECMLAEMDYEAATEGANNESRKLNKSYSKEIRGLAKQAKAAYKQGNYTESKNLYNKCAQLCNEMVSDIKRLDQSSFEVQIGNLLHGLKTIGATLAIGGLAEGILQDQRDIQTKIDTLNSAGRSELTKADINKYTRDIISKAQMRADKFKKLADKAAKGELNQVSATEGFDADMFDYDAFMFACESYMDEMMAAMEAEEGEDASEEGGKSPSGLAAKVRSAAAKLKSAFKRGDKKAAEEAKAEVDSATKELADAEADAPDEKKESYKKAAKTAAIAVGSVAAVVGLTAAGTAIYQKAKGQTIDPMALYKMAGSVTSGAVKKVGSAGNSFVENQKNAAASRAVGREEKKAAKLEERNQRANQYFVDQTEKGRAKSLKAQDNEIMKYNKAKAKAAKKEAKAAAKAAKEAFGISEFDAYEVIYEALCAEDYSFEAYETDEDLANAIEAML